MRSRSSTGERPALYSGFSGLNTERGSIALESPNSQAFVELVGLVCTPDGTLTTEPARRLIDRSVLGGIVYVAPDAPNGVAYCVTAANPRQRIGGYNFSNSINGQPATRFEWTPFVKQPDSRALGQPPSTNAGNGSATPVGTRVESQAMLRIPDRRILLGARAGVPTTASPNVAPWSITGTGLSGLYAATSVQGRIVVLNEAGGTELLVSRAGDETVWPDQETPGDPSVLKAFFLDVGPVMPEGAIAVAAFEADKLAVFSQRRCIVYQAGVSLNDWELLKGVETPVGCIGPRAVIAVGDEVFFASERGIHSLRRSDENGVTVFARPVSESIRTRYAELLASVHAGNSALVNMAYDPSSGSLHAFFPLDGEARRLTLRLSPERIQSDSPGSWYESVHDNVFCAAWDGRRMLLGCDDGSVYEEVPSQPLLEPPPGRAVTPMLWLGSLTEPKQASRLMLLADGVGEVIVRASDDEGRDLGAVEFSLTPPPDGVSAAQAGERSLTQPFPRRFTGLRLTIEVNPKSRVRIFGLGVIVKED
ncbi:hypothetical protein UFOVP708_64 [uncultured Caudovirales phage]|uniref:Uncharacterized protein n=1 Tax=uncultured Caudovirales phage TaxID=2100421 RepID=A0A6J5NK74_9CAUD|nr:hypothetical protein UFOVP708_64 [uncultured Caudovirales phage]